MVKKIKNIFVVSAYIGDLETIMAMVSSTDINIKGENNETALIAASSRNNINVVSFLLSQDNIDINHQDKDETTALIWASLYGHIEIVDLLLKAGADPNLKNKYGHTALMSSIDADDNIEIIKLLLKAGADPNIQDNEETTPLMNLVSNNLEAVKLLLEAGANPNLKNKYGQTALIVSNNLKIIRVLLKAGADPNIQDDDGHVTLMYADNNDITNILLEYKANINIQDNEGQTTLMHALYNDHHNIDILLNHPTLNIDIKTKTGKTYLHFAFASRNYRIFESVVNKIGDRIDVNHQDDEGKTALMNIKTFRIMNEFVSLYKYKHVNVNLQDNKGKTALTYAIINCDECVRILVYNFDELHARKKDVVIAAKIGNTYAISILLENFKYLREHANDVFINSINKNYHDEVIDLLLDRYSSYLDPYSFDKDRKQLFYYLTKKRPSMDIIAKFVDVLNLKSDIQSLIYIAMINRNLYIAISLAGKYSSIKNCILMNLNDDIDLHHLNDDDDNIILIWRNNDDIKISYSSFSDLFQFELFVECRGETTGVITPNDVFIDKVYVKIPSFPHLLNFFNLQPFLTRLHGRIFGLIKQDTISYTTRLRNVSFNGLNMYNEYIQYEEYQCNVQELDVYDVKKIDLVEDINSVVKMINCD